MISFTVYGDVAAEARARHSGIRHGRPYTPPNTVAWRLIIREEAFKHKPDVLWDGPIGLAITHYKLAPKSAPKRVYNRTKPDVDNIEAMVMNSLKGIIYTDDCRIVHIETDKLCGDPPRMEIGLWQMEEAGA